MINQKKPVLGVLALMLAAYEPLFPGIRARQEAYAREVIASLSQEADFIFPGAALGREDIERYTEQFHQQGADGIVILLLSYSEGQFLVRAMQNCRLPVALTLIQPDETVENDFEELDLTVNQGIHGSQDNANCLMRAGINCAYFAGSRKDGSLNLFISDFGKAAQTVRQLKNMKIGVIGKLSGMGDVITDDMAFFRKIGPIFTYDSIGVIHSSCEAVSQEEIDARVAMDRTIFDMDPNLSPESHAYAIRLYLGIRKYIEERGYEGYTIQFDELGADGRFRQLPLLAASHLMADGYGYAAEGDAVTAALVAATQTLCGNANFSEMYMMDLKRDAILFCHAGEGNWSTCSEDRKPRLIDRFFGEGGLGNPPTPIFTPKPGNATIASLIHVGGEHFRLICSTGEILDKSDLTRCDMPYFFFRPDTGVKHCVTGWLENGGAHHEAIALGLHDSRLKLLCKMLGVEFIKV